MGLASVAAALVMSSMGLKRATIRCGAGRLGVAGVLASFPAW